MSDGTYTGYKSRSFADAVKLCNEYWLPADIRKLDASKSSFGPVVYCNIQNSDNIYLRRQPVTIAF